MATAYENRESKSTRNPHAARGGPQRSARELAKLNNEERILAQWNAAFGCPISDESKADFTISCQDRGFVLGDCRLWMQKHHNKALDQAALEEGKIYLEFFFDGSPNDLGDKEELFIKAFEANVESKLQEHRVTEFRDRLAARRRPQGARNRGVDAEDGGEGGRREVDDNDWKSYLQRPAQPTQLKVQSLREAGCMITFLVVQTSLSISGAEQFGQAAFPEHFPVDGKAQVLQSSGKPIPRWMYWMVSLGAILALIVLIAWWQVLRTIIMSSNRAALSGASL